MDYGLTEEQQAIQETARDIAQKKIIGPGVGNIGDDGDPEAMAGRALPFALAFLPVEAVHLLGRKLRPHGGRVGGPDFDLVAALFGEGSALSRIVYVLVGLAALFCLYTTTKMGRRTAA